MSLLPWQALLILNCRKTFLKIERPLNIPSHKGEMPSSPRPPCLCPRSLTVLCQWDPTHSAHIPTAFPQLWILSLPSRALLKAHLVWPNNCQLFLQPTTFPTSPEQQHVKKTANLGLWQCAWEAVCGGGWVGAPLGYSKEPGRLSGGGRGRDRDSQSRSALTFRAAGTALLCLQLPWRVWFAA